MDWPHDFLPKDGRPEGILLVDDDERVLKFVSRMLYSFGYEEVYTASSAEEGLRHWKANRQKIWLVITDFVMPMTTGDIMAMQMLMERPSLKVLFISGNDSASLVSKIPLRPGKNFVQKPFTIAEFRQVLRDIAASTDSPASMSKR
jgi:two-component system, cell cycle sensor histidine kinase and response regulator CckA